MSQPAGKSHRDAPTEDRLIEAGELLFGRHGLDGVSLRQIAAAAGCHNSSAVLYHFGSKHGLVMAIFERRLKSLEVSRAVLLSEARRGGKENDLRTLLEIFLRPIAEERDAEGRRSYAAFMFGLRLQRSLKEVRLSQASHAPLAHRLMEMLEHAAGPLPAGVFQRRLVGAAILFWNALGDVDEEAHDGFSLIDEEQILDDALNTGAAVLLAPAPNPSAKWPSTLRPADGAAG